MGYVVNADKHDHKETITLHIFNSVAYIIVLQRFGVGH